MTGTYYETYPISVSAGGRATIELGARYVRCLKANHAEFMVGLNNSTPNNLYAQGLQFGHDAGDSPITRIEFYNPNDTTLDVVLGSSNAPISDDRLTISGSITAKKPAASLGGAQRTAVSAGGGSLVASNTGRISIYIENESLTNDLFIAASAANLTANAGITIEAGASATVETVDEIFAKGVGGSVFARYQEFNA